jgi:hypothetical protein
VPPDRLQRHLAWLTVVGLASLFDVSLACTAAFAADDTQGVLLGLRYPAHASPDDRVRYQTLWIVVSGESATLVGRADGIVIPRPAGGFWELDIDSAGWRGLSSDGAEECSSQAWRRTRLDRAPVRVDSLVAHPLGRAPRAPQSIPQDLLDLCCFEGARWSRMITLQHAGPSYITVKIEEDGWCGGNSPEGFAHYVLSRVEDRGHTIVPLKHFWPVDGEAAYRRAAREFLRENNAAMQLPPDACEGEPDLSNWGISRAPGTWEGVGYQNYVNRYCAPASGDFVVGLDPPRELAANAKSGLPWEAVEAAIPGAVDAVYGLKRDVLAVVTTNAIRLYHIRNGKLGHSLSTVPIQSDGTSPAVVSVEWAVGWHVEEWSRALATSLR